MGQPVTFVAVAVAGGVGASGGVVAADGEGGGSVGDGEGAVGDVKGVGVAGHIDGERVVSSCWGRNVSGPDVALVVRVLGMTRRVEGMMSLAVEVC